MKVFTSLVLALTLASASTAMAGESEKCQTFKAKVRKDWLENMQGLLDLLGAHPETFLTEIPTSTYVASRVCELKSHDACIKAITRAMVASRITTLEEVVGQEEGCTPR